MRKAIRKRLALIPRGFTSALVAVAILLMAAGCGGGGGGGNAAPTNTFAYRSEVYDIPQDGSVVVSQLSPSKLSLTGTLPIIKPGSVLVSRAGEGFARRVTQVAPGAGGIEVETVQASLPEIFSEANLKQDKVLGPDSFAVVESLVPGATIGPGRSSGRDGRLSTEFAINFSNAEFPPAPLPGSPPREWFIVLNGSGTLRIAEETEVIIDLLGLKHLRVVPSITLNLNVRISGRMETEELRVPLFRMVGAPIFLGPVVLLPTFDVGPKFQGYFEFGANLVDVSLSQQVATGFQYTRETGWSRIENLNHRTSSNPSPNLYAEGGASLTLASAEFGTKIYGIIGPSVEMEFPRLEASLAFETSPPGRRFKAGATFAASGKFRAEILGQGVGVEFPDLLTHSVNVLDLFWPDNGSVKAIIR